ncbi:microprocessor complex subunit DGCR8 isoform X2 [Zootermopsis nevadensis]|uniref:Microprocessor complex subunit DGCR8 n=2 Tax=Zootermopsis nevadensis TaxID=136037 RepID=A0A067R900_ZOONE|nr:microprocessor complex subunit DGCR8 isoform X2 [Zootermopsis nevadensis]XP_021918843.1 microprocessor complex subunit DGCR8 isoform X2 [Zootermopsis nevadensis]KDR19996.1 Microprocessor complex subunit DGCR8 [Zootermopsis nevadensis]
MVQQKRKASDEGEGVEETRKCPYVPRDMSVSTVSSNTNCNSPSGASVSPAKATNSCDSSVSRVKQEMECEVNSETEETGEVEEDVAVDIDESQALREFDVLDEEDYDQDSENQSEGSFDSDVPDEEIEAMLEEGLPEEFKGRRRKSFGQKDGDDASSRYEEKEKIVLEEIGHNHFDVLPEGWVQVTHNSGMPIYLHKQSRVCTLSQPYFLGPGSARKHEVPLSAIPCLQYQRALETEAVNKQQMPTANSDPAATNIMNGDRNSLPSACIETIQENKATQSLNAIQVREYCQKLFQFKTIKVLRFKSWSDRRCFTKHRKHQRLQRPTLPEGTKLIKFPLPVQSQDSGKGHPNVRGPKKEWIMNPNGKSYVCILHEYVQHALKKQPSYEFKELENAATPYAATVTINSMQYGVGYGTSKKQAKSEAARATLEILIPEMREKIQEDKRVGARGTSKSQDTDLSFFDEIKIEDPRVAELCAKTTEPSPYAILLTCLQRNFGLGEMHIKYEVNTLRHQKNEFTMTVGRHRAKVICKNKRDGKQRASQSILQALHPHITSWGSLLRLYGNRSVKSIKEKKQEEQEITLLQSKASINSPNFAILDKLKSEMRKLKEIKAAIQPIGKFIPPDDVALPSSSGADLNNVDL